MFKNSGNRQTLLLFLLLPFSLAAPDRKASFFFCGKMNVVIPRNAGLLPSCQSVFLKMRGRLAVADRETRQFVNQLRNMTSS